MNDTKNDEPQNAYKRLKEDQSDPTAMAHSGATTAFTNPMPEAYPNPNAMAYPNPNSMPYPNQNAMAHPNPNALGYPNPNSMPYPNQNAMAHPNPNALAYPNTNAMPHPGSNATSNLDSNTMAPTTLNYANVYPQGTKFSTAPDSENPNIGNEAQKPFDDETIVVVPGFDFNEKIIRKMFIRKVYAVLMCQLLLTVAITAFFMYCEPVRSFMLRRENIVPVYMSMFLFGLVLMIMILCTDLRRVAPWNLVFLGMFTVTQGTVVGILAVHVDSNEILLAFGITAAVVLSLTLYAFHTKWDFSTIGGGLLATLMVLIIFGSLAALLPHYRTLRLLYCGAGVILFSFYIIYDTQLMIGGEHKYSISPEEYVFAALTLYLDILNLLIYILRMLRS